MTQIRKNIAGYNNLYQVSNMKYTVYVIRHISTGMVLYVGKTRNFKKRAYQHLSLNAHSKKWLSVIGTGNVLIEEVAKFYNETDALKYEDELILKYGTIANGYNEQRSGLITENIYEYYKKYMQIDEHREHHKESQRKYDRERMKTDKRIEYMRNYQRDYQRYYKKAKKLGVSVADYRKLKKDQDITLEQNKKKEIQLTINF